MTDYYLDASALVKRYATEPGSDWVLGVSDPTAGHTIILSEITLAEVSAALAANNAPLVGSRWKNETGRSAVSYRIVPRSFCFSR